jgi:hypothetical protein
MTGRDLILYILSNNLEDELVFKDGNLLGFISIGQAAEKMNVGYATVCAWISEDRIPHFHANEYVYIPADFKVEGLDEQ